MDLQNLLDEIDKTKQKIATLNGLLDQIGQAEPRISISARGSWNVYFDKEDVLNLLLNRENQLNNRLKILTDAKDAAEKTAKGWLSSDR